MADPLVPSKDVCFELGRLLMGLREYATAIEFFNKSNELCGQHHVTVRSCGGEDAIMSFLHVLGAPHW